MRKQILIGSSFFALLAVGYFVWHWKDFNHQDEQYLVASPQVEGTASFLAKSKSPTLAPVIFVSPRQNIPKGAPTLYGFWSLAQPVTGTLSRSGQPLMSEFRWLQSQGWRGVVDVRRDGEYGEIGNDARLRGFNQLGFHYLYLPIRDGAAPTEDQAKQFLAFATDPKNQPVHVHCRGGFGRTGTMIALYRDAVQGWPMDKAIAESRLFAGGVSTAQTKWLQAWARNNKPGSYN